MYTHIAYFDETGDDGNKIIDKSHILKRDYKILENALKYNIQRIENTSGGNWNYLLVSDEGRIAPMRKTARAIRAFNPIKSMFDDFSYTNKPIQFMIEDIFEKNSRESYFIQVCDFISYFVHLYYKSIIKKESLPNRVANLIDNKFIQNTMKYFKENSVFNLNASPSNEYGLVIYPKK